MTAEAYPAWMDEAICPQTDPEAFFPEATGRGGAAKRICVRCPVIEECLAYAEEHDLDGVWGGMTPRDRVRHKRR